mgnify:CR=1 FL=1
MSWEKTPIDFMDPVQNGSLLNFSEFTVSVDRPVRVVGCGVDMMSHNYG